VAKYGFMFGVILFMVGALVWGYEKTREQRIEDSRRELNVARSEYSAEWEKFRRESEQTIAVNEKWIEEFKEKIENSGPVYRAMHNRETVVLQQRNRNLKIQLTEYEEGGQTNWKEFMIIFTKRIDNVEKTMNDLFANID